MDDNARVVDIHVVVEIQTAALEQIVENAKKKVGRDEKGRYRVDTADKTGELISRFLRENDFLAYVENPDHY